jgi:hypothetical protein
MKLNLNYSLMDLLKNFVIIFKNFPVGYLFKLKDVLNSVHLFSFIKSGLVFDLIFILKYFLATSLRAGGAVERQQQHKHHFWYFFCLMILVPRRR